MPISRYDYQSAVWLHPLLSRVVTTLDQKLQSNLPQLPGRTEIVAQHLSKYASIYREYKLDKICDFYAGQKLLSNNLQRERLIILVAPLQISRSCPDSLRDDLPIELVEELKCFIQQDYSFPHSRPLELHTHFLLNPLHDQDIENLHRLLAPLPVLIIYTTITDCRVYIHLAWWIVPTALVEYLSLHSWDWEELLEKLIAEGMKESQAVRLIRHAVRRIYQFILVIFTEWYYSFTYGDSYLKVLQGIAPLPALDTLEINLSLIRQEGRRQQNLLIKSKQQKQGALQQKLQKMAQQWQLIQQFSPCQGMVLGVIFYPQDNWIIVAGSQGFLKVVSLLHQNEIVTLNGHQGDIVGMVASHEYKFLATSSTDRQVKLWNLANFGEVMGWELDSVGNCVSFSPDSRFLACATHDGYIKVWDLWTGKLFRELSDHQQAIYSVLFSPDGKFLLTGGQDGYIKVWNYTKGNLDYTFLAHDQGVFRIVFSPDGNYLASSGKNGGLRLWQKYNWTALTELAQDRITVTAITFNATGEILAVGGLDGRVELWDMQSRQKFTELSRNSHPILCLAFDQHHRLAVGSSWQNNLRIWQYIETNPLLSIPPPQQLQ